MKMQLVLHPTDGSESAKKALELACDLAKVNRAKLLILHVQRRHGSDFVPEELQYYERTENMPVTEAELLHKIAPDIVSEVTAAAREAGLSDVEGLVVEGDPTRQINEVAKERQADAIVMGSRGRGGQHLGYAIPRYPEIARDLTTAPALFEVRNPHSTI
jgi:nucleotide-binding universal stress UspA family protein